MPVVQSANAAPVMEAVRSSAAAAAGSGSAAAAAGPEDSEMPPTEAAVRAKVEEDQPARAKRIPGEPTAAERAAHELTHVPSRSWCSVCVQAKGIDDRHCKRAGPTEIDEVQADYQFLGKITILTLVHVNSSATFGVAGPKGVNPYMVQAVLNILDCWGIQEVTFRTARILRCRPWLAKSGPSGHIAC